MFCSQILRQSWRNKWRRTVSEDMDSFPGRSLLRLSSPWLCISRLLFCRSSQHGKSLLAWNTQSVFNPAGITGRHQRSSFPGRPAEQVSHPAGPAAGQPVDQAAAHGQNQNRGKVIVDAGEKPLNGTFIYNTCSWNAQVSLSHTHQGFPGFDS